MNYSVSSLRALPPNLLRERLENLSPAERAALFYTWRFWARPSQLPPEWDWVYWLVKAGRGFGKTRIGAETVREWVKTNSLVNLIGATADDARDIMIEGESGILAICPPDERPLYKKSDRRLDWPNGAKSLIFTADEPDRLRGKQHQKLWGDEVAAWRYEESLDQAMFGLRLGGKPQAILTTTPRPTKMIKQLMQDSTCAVTHGGTKDNAANLAKNFMRKIITKYEGTRLGRQELDGEVLDDNPNAIFQRADIDNNRWKLADVPHLRLIAVGVDPAVSSNEDSSLTGIVCAGVQYDNKGVLHAFVLDDESLIAKPLAWAKKVDQLYDKRFANMVVGEVNNGGELVEANIKTVNPMLSYTAVRATRGKAIRAEPVASLYEQGRIHHVGTFAKLEDEMCDFDPLTYEKSPDRMDALVWVITFLMLDENGPNYAALSR